VTLSLFMTPVLHEIRACEHSSSALDALLKMRVQNYAEKDATGSWLAMAASSSDALGRRPRRRFRQA